MDAQVAAELCDDIRRLNPGLRLAGESGKVDPGESVKHRARQGPGQWISYAPDPESINVTAGLVACRPSNEGISLSWQTRRDKRMITIVIPAPVIDELLADAVAGQLPRSKEPGIRPAEAVASQLSMLIDEDFGWRLPDEIDGSELTLG
jgi:hypothetical protein